MPRPDDPEILESVYDDLKRGIPLRHAAVRAGISEDTAYHWLTEARQIPVTDGEELSSQVLFGQVVKEGLAACVDDRLTKSDGAEGNNWQKHITILERRFPDDFGRNQRITTESVTVSVQVSAQLTEGQLTDLMQSLADRATAQRALPQLTETTPPRQLTD